MRMYKCVYQSMGSVCCEWSTDDSQLSELEEADARNVVDVLRQRQPTVDKDSQIWRSQRVEDRRPTPSFRYRCSDADDG